MAVLLDSVPPLQTEMGANGERPKATFFVLAWLAERLPHLVREIQARGHEVASHGFYHELCPQLSPVELARDLSESKKMLEDLLGIPVLGYRAPSFSIDEKSLKIIEDCGYHYDSSFNSFGMHGRYGHVDLSQKDRKGVALEVSRNFFEIPISNLKLWGNVVPLGGGGYFRLIPYSVYKKGVRSILEKENTYVFYMHPWEIDPEQPRVRQASASCRFRHYVNLKKTHAKLTALLETFSAFPFVTCRQYLKHVMC